MLNVAVQIDGLDTLVEAFQNWPELVIEAADAAGQEARSVILQAIQAHTPVRSGFLRNSEDVALVDHFTLQAEATANYASFVHARVPFLELGEHDVAAEVEAIYDRALDRVAQRI